jgi:putative transposase
MGRVANALSGVQTTKSDARRRIARFQRALDHKARLCFVLSMGRIEKPGWHERGYLPHLDANPLSQHIVFRTVSSLPRQIVDQAASAPPELKRGLMDQALDCSSEGYLFDDPAYADIMQNAVRFFDGDRYDLQAWCIMPNHVHVVLVTDPDVFLGAVIRSWKYHVALEINKVRGSTGRVFAPDYFDRFVRNLKQAEKAIHYVEANPVKAGIVKVASDYPWSSAHFRANSWSPRHNRLPLFID